MFDALMLATTSLLFGLLLGWLFNDRRDDDG